MKTCSKCRQSVSFDEFNKDATRKDGLSPSCKHCAKEYRTNNKEALLRKKKEYWEKNRDSLVIKSRNRYHSNKEMYIRKQRKYLSVPDNFIKRLVAKSKSRAEELGIEHSLVAENIKIPTHCPYLGIELTYKLGHGQLTTNASLDRIDSTLGYTNGNVQIVSRLANTMKSNATEEQLITFAQRILQLHGSKNL